MTPPASEVIGLRSDGTLAHSDLTAVPAGLYGAIGAGNGHGLAIIPAPSAFLLVMVGSVLAARRRRRST